MDIQPEYDFDFQQLKQLWQFVINDSTVGMMVFVIVLIIWCYYLMLDRIKKSNHQKRVQDESSRKREQFVNRFQKQQRMVDQQDQTTHERLRRQNIYREMRENAKKRSYKVDQKQGKESSSIRNNPELFLERKSIALTKIKKVLKQPRFGQVELATKQTNYKFDLSEGFNQIKGKNEQQKKQDIKNHQIQTNGLKEEKSPEKNKEQLFKTAIFGKAPQVRSDSRKNTLQQNIQKENQKDKKNQNFQMPQTINRIVSFGDPIKSATLFVDKQKIPTDNSLFSFKKSENEAPPKIDQPKGFQTKGISNNGTSMLDKSKTIFGNTLTPIGNQQNQKNGSTRPNAQNQGQIFSLFGSQGKNNGIPNISQPGLFNSPFSNSFMSSTNNNPPTPTIVPNVLTNQRTNLQNTQKTLQSVPKPIQKPISQPVNQPIRPKDKFSPQEFLESYTKFVQKLKQQVPISTKLQNLLGARSSPNDILIQAKSLIGTIDKNDDKQITTFGLRLFDTIVYKFINNSNVKTGLERVPPKSRTDQCEKNSINCYILALNIYRLMNQSKKVWVIVFGKLLKLLQFLYKRKQDLKSYHELQLIQNGYIKKFKEVHSKYLSRIDFLIYMLLGMTAFDPILILRNIEQKDRSVEKSRQEIQSWRNVWSYNQFWSLVSATLNNKHESYSKPIFFMNLLYILYPRIYEHKGNPANFKQENDLFLATLEKSKKYLENFKKIKQVKTLSVEQETREYEYDGDDFIKSIKVLDNRMPQKGLEIKMSARDFEAKANIFYYFSKEK